MTFTELSDYVKKERDEVNQLFSEAYTAYKNENDYGGAEAMLYCSETVDITFVRIMHKINKLRAEMSN